MNPNVTNYSSFERARRDESNKLEIKVRMILNKVMIWVLYYTSPHIPMAGWSLFRALPYSFTFWLSLLNKAKNDKAKMWLSLL